ncbi:XK-related protein 6-like [Branchiostoma floridae x Branchiostoma belcheri]
MAETAGPDPEEQDCLSSVWNSLPMKILSLVLFPLSLYLFDVTTDLWLAVQYYNSGDSIWFGLTLTFVLVPSIFMSFTSLFTSVNAEDTTLNMNLMFVLTILQLGVTHSYVNILHMLLRGRDVEQHVEGGLPIVHLLEAMLECVPQLCLQFYIIISTSEQVSVLKVISMVASLLAAVKAAVTFVYYGMKESDRKFNPGFVTLRLVLLTVWKVVEIIVRVLALGLFASAFKTWIALPIGVAGNITMVTVWYTLKVGQDRYQFEALMGILGGSFISVGLGIMEMVFNGNIK